MQNRSAIREYIGAGLEALHGPAVYAVYPYMATGFEGRSPIVRVLNAGSVRPRRAGYNTQAIKTKVRYVIQHFVRFDDAMSAQDQADAEDALDALEAGLSSFIADNDQVAGLWKSIEQIDLSEPILVKVGSYQYLLESFLVEVQTYE